MSVEDCTRANKESVDFSFQGISLWCPFGSAIHFHNWLMIESSGVLPAQCVSINNVFPVTSWRLSCLFYFQRSVGWRTGRCSSTNSKVAVVTVERCGVESPPTPEPPPCARGFLSPSWTPHFTHAASGSWSRAFNKGLETPPLVCWIYFVFQFRQRQSYYVLVFT